MPVYQKTLDYVKDNIPWFQWKEAAKYDDIYFVLEAAVLSKNPETIEAIWAYYFNTCFPNKKLPSGSASYEVAFSIVYSRVLADISNSEDFIFLSDSLWDDEEIAFKMLSYSDNVMNFVSNRLKNSKDFVLQAVAVDGTAFSYLSNTFKADREVIEAALNCTSTILSYLPGELREDRALILIALKGKDNTEVFENLPTQFLDDKEIILLMVNSRGLYLQNVSNRLKADEEVIEAACMQDPEAGQYALRRSKRLRLCDEWLSTTSNTSHHNDEDRASLSN
ncbi:MAG: DUF4116 domain-containing protein [Legionella sp.]|nr:DUF4116 domain-containing protein [Legionella sp.]